MMKYSIILLLISILYGCNLKKQQISSSNVNNYSSFELFLNKLNVDSKSIKTNTGKYVFSVLFYSFDDNSHFFRLYESNQILPEKIKGFSELDKFVILYPGINDALAEKYIHIIKINWDTFDTKYNLSKPCFDCANEPEKMILNERYYKIISDTIIEQFYPNREHLENFEKELIKNGYIILPPPPPVQ